ncbi:HNH endonuclease (fragment) [Frankia canadensis]|uniref:HNH endonuclease n=1 Tax=Frankia canadensis TaxID=1836972 RepID=A0A2I2KRK4_9ACTN
MAGHYLGQRLPTLADPSPYIVNVHIDIDTLIGAAVHEDPNKSDQGKENRPTRRRCEVERGPVLSPSLARQLSCDSILQTIVTDAEGNPLALGRTRRRPTTTLRRAFYARDGGVCQFPGCRHRRWLQIHHLLEWRADDGGTEPANLILICSTDHHRLVHDRSLKLRRGQGGDLLVLWPDGTVLRDAPTMVTTSDPLAAFDRFTTLRSGDGQSAPQAA